MKGMIKCAALAAMMLTFAVVDAHGKRPSTVAPHCRALDSGAASFRRYITKFDTGTSIKAAEDRAIWNLPAVPASEIYFVTDSIPCSLAAKAHEAAVKGDTLDPYPVHLLRIGSTRYIALNWTMIAGWFHYAVLDSNFTLLSSVGS